MRSAPRVSEKRAPAPHLTSLRCGRLHAPSRLITTGETFLRSFRAAAAADQSQFQNNPFPGFIFCVPLLT